MRLSEITASALFGQSLIDNYYKLLCSRYGGRTSAFFKLLRSELRTIFKFIRNDFAHALRDITEGQCRILLDRTSSALQKVNDIELAERSGGHLWVRSGSAASQTVVRSKPTTLLTISALRPALWPVTQCRRWCTWHSWLVSRGRRAPLRRCPARLRP